MTPGRGKQGTEGSRCRGVSEPFQAQQWRAADCLQPTLRCGFRQQLKPGVRLLKLHCMHGLKNVA